MPFDLVAEKIGEGGAEWPVHFPNSDFWFGGGAGRSAGDEALAHSQDNAVSHAAQVSLGCWNDWPDYGREHRPSQCLGKRKAADASPSSSEMR